jgi:hypothetical protein
VFTNHLADIYIKKLMCNQRLGCAHNPQIANGNQQKQKTKKKKKLATEFDTRIGYYFPIFDAGCKHFK